MKKLISLAFLACVVLSLTCCVTAKKTKESKSKSPFGEVFQVPAAEFDTDEYFGATGIAYGKATQMGELQKVALANAQDIVRQKAKHTYKGMISSYSSAMDVGKGQGIQSKMETGGNQIIDAIINDTKATQGPLYSEVDEKGNVSCYIGVRVNKKELAEALSDFVTQDQELKLRFDEDQFRERMKKEFEEYKENNR